MKDKNLSAYDIIYKPLTLNGDGVTVDMNVNGATTPSRFIAEIPSRGREFVLVNMSFGIVGGRMDNPANFSGLAAPLTNGIQIGFYYKGTEQPIILPLKTNADINIRTISEIVDYETNTQDVIRAELFGYYNVVFNDEYLEYLYFQIDDDLTGLALFQGYVRGYYQN